VTVTLRDILAVIDHSPFEGDSSTRVSGVTHDSRKIQPGWIFVALPGGHTDGLNYVGDAILSGAVAVIAEKPAPRGPEKTPWVVVPNARKALGAIAACVHDHPTRALILVGITGTSGKTTLTYLLEKIVEMAGGTPGVVGTINYRWGGEERPAGNTTPEASDLQAIFDEMVRAGVTHGIIEASSHGLHLDRLEGCDFDLGVFTNLSHDHLDYHGDLEQYYQAKRILFEELLPRSSKATVAAVINLDDPYGRRLASEIRSVPVTGFGTSADCDVRPTDVNLTPTGMAATVSTPTGEIQIKSSLTGTFNLLNVLAAVAVSTKLGIRPEAVCQGIERMHVVPGRLERVVSQRGNIFVDYAHKPEALKKVLEALHDLHAGRIITIVGCGGDRDKTKRPIMGREAAAGSEFVVVTSDNPRSEEPISIVDQVAEGVRGYGYRPVPPDKGNRRLPSGCFAVIPDRREAIRWALGHLQDEEILLVAGKGHETYQEITGVRYPFDDRAVIQEEIKSIDDSRSRDEGSSFKAVATADAANSQRGGQ
jgi:UDP-N-acetylmuramoyl-L-alanyl-D-glutamate--2,6-diaminopimelate ligase